MGRRRWNKKNPEKQAALRARAQVAEQGDPAVRLLAVHPFTPVAAVAMGTSVRVTDYSSGKALQLQPAPLQLPHAGGHKHKHKAHGHGQGDAKDAPPQQPEAHVANGIMRVLAFSPDGRFLLTAADDKYARAWETDTWRCVAVWNLPKKPSAGAFTPDSRYLLVADKFGDVCIGELPSKAADGVPAQEQAAAEGGAAAAPAALAPRDPSTLLGHFCSIISAVVPSPCGRLLATTDKDYKVRVSVFPLETPLLGAYEIQTYCMGHQEYASCAAWVAQPGAPLLLLSGSGDGSVRLWDPMQGKQLAMYVASAPEGAEAAGASGAGAEQGATEPGTSGAGAGGEEEQAEGDADADADADADDEGEEGDEEGDDGEDASKEQGGGGGGGDEPQRRSHAPKCSPVLSLAVSPDGRCAAVVVEGNDEVQVLEVDAAAGTLALRQRLAWPGVHFPRQALFDSAGHLWVAGGVPIASARSAHVGVAKASADGSFAPCTEALVSAEARAELEQRVPEEETKMADDGELCVSACSAHMRKRASYTEEELEQRKRQRNDWKESQRLAQLREKQEKKQAAAGEQGQQGQGEQN